MTRLIAGALALLALAPGAAAAAAEWRFTTVRESVIGTHLRGAQYAGGVRVDGSAALVSVVGGRVVSSVREGGRSWRPVDRPIAGGAARAAALRLLGLDAADRISSERLLTARGDVHRVTVFSLRPARAATVDVSAATGRVVVVRDNRRYADAAAGLFDPNPVVTAHDSSLRQPAETGLPLDADLDSTELTAQLKPMAVRDFDAVQAAAGLLAGPWAHVQGVGPYVPVEGELPYTRGMPQFEGLMAYAHIDRFQRYLQDTLGFSGTAAINAEPQDVYALPVAGFDNSFYQPANDLMLFGAGGVDDAEDAEVILHEYGHAVQDAQVPGWGANAEGGAMGEGFGDFQAAAYFARSDTFGELCIADWDATSYSSADPPCLRRMDSTKTWTGTPTEVHDDGELWAAFLWRVRSHLGSTPVEMSDNSLRLVLASHELLTPNAKFADAVKALRTAATALGHPEWVEVIDAEARVTGFVR